MIIVTHVYRIDRFKKPTKCEALLATVLLKVSVIGCQLPYMAVTPKHVAAN
jgi:hypothetical protein